MAFISVVTEAIMVTESREDLNFGAQDFLALNFFSRGVGGVVGSIFGGSLTENYDPSYVFLWYSLIGIILMAFA